MDYNSEFDSDVEGVNRKRKRELQNEKRPVVTEHLPSHFVSGSSHSKVHHSRASLDFDKEEASRHRQQFLSLNAFDRHKKLVNDYLKFYGGKRSDFKRDTRFDKSDLDVIRENVKFVYSDDEAESELSDWNERIAKRYWDKLYKEYAIADLTYFKTGQIGMRWRTEKEVVSGKGQFECGNKFCAEIESLESWEVNFSYKEGDSVKNALVKLRLCADCSFKLNYKKQHQKSKAIKREVEAREKKSKKKHKKHKKEEKKRLKREQSSDDDDKRSEGNSNDKAETSRSLSEESQEKKEAEPENIWVKKADEEKNLLDDENNIDEDIDNYFLDMLS
ncbi:protein FRA10AC1-like [Convolutriloba macropyga]|uniref:protein FRA10AC1-like n=1 Tax=Convolutriloba macropyga TaxID=536237 RepID=UPI003F526389